MDERYLAGDIGGTKTRLALYSTQAGAYDPLEKETYPSQDYSSLEGILQVFLSDKPYRLTGASFGIAGPIIGNRAQVTNLSWVVDADNLSKVIGNVPINLLNDLHAIASAIPYLKPDDLEVLIPGEPDVQGAKGVIAPGTGLGEGFLVWDGKLYTPHPS